MRHPLHSICPYFAVFPESFVTRNVLAYSRPGDYVFDPFVGRGTTVFESLLNGRRAAGTDTNPVAVCIAGAKADAPDLASVLNRLSELQQSIADVGAADAPEGEFFRCCFHPETLAQIMHLRSQLCWRESVVDRFIAAISLGILHGESHRSPNYLSNRMPRTISTKPDYSVRWWTARGLVAPRRDAFEILRRVASFRLSRADVELKGKVILQDARLATSAFPELNHVVKLIVTSPPYLDTTHFQEDQWLRLWFLGGAERPGSRAEGDDRHTNLDNYWQFLTEAWTGCAGLLASGSTFVVRIGGTRVSGDVLSAGLTSSLIRGLSPFRVTAVQFGTPTHIKNRQTDVFRPGTNAQRFEYDFVFAVE